MYVFFVPYLVVLSFFLEGRKGIPPAYHLFQFFIARSGRRQMDDATRKRGVTFDASGFYRKVSPGRADRHQAAMEEKELREATKRAAEATRRANERSAKLSAAEEARVRAAEDAVRKMEEQQRAKAREEAIRNERRRR